MYVIVLGVAIFIISMGLSTIIIPTTVRTILNDFLKKKWLWPVSSLRLILGVIFLLSAEQCTMPTFITVMGVVLIIAGITLPIFGSNRVQSMAQMWMSQKDWMIRIWGIFAMLFGIAVAIAGMAV